MKTYREILDEIFNKGGIPLSEVYESAAKEYARQCCEDLKSRLTNQSYKTTKNQWGGYVGGIIEVVNKNTILNTEIILP